MRNLHWFDNVDIDRSKSAKHTGSRTHWNNWTLCKLNVNVSYKNIYVQNVKDVGNTTHQIIHHPIKNINFHELIVEKYMGES